MTVTAIAASARVGFASAARPGGSRRAKASRNAAAIIKIAIARGITTGSPETSIAFGQSVDCHAITPASTTRIPAATQSPNKCFGAATNLLLQQAGFAQRWLEGLLHSIKEITEFVAFKIDTRQR